LVEREPAPQGAGFLLLQGNPEDFYRGIYEKRKRAGNLQKQNKTKTFNICTLTKYQLTY